MTDEKKDKVEIHIVLEGSGVTEISGLVKKVFGVERGEIPGGLPITPASSVDEYVEVKNEVCPACGFLPVFDFDDNIDHDSSHVKTCVYYKGK